MRRALLSLAALALCAAQAQAAGLLIPTEKKLPPLAMLDHKVEVAIDEQVAVTRIEQTFRNHTERRLEATYIFPVPKGASVRKFSMWVNGKEMPGELVEADKARKIYTDIVQQTKDPGLLEYMGTNVLRLRVFPVLPKSDQKIAISYTSIAEADNGLIQYVYPLKTDGRAASTLEKFTVSIKLKSQRPITNIYSPSHAITTSRPSEREAVVGFEKDAALLDRDFQLYYQAGGKDVGLTALAHRPSPGQPGYFLMLISPRAELSKSQQVPRDMVFVLDTSGSMRGKRIVQARGALKYCLANLNENDRFAVLNFATTVNKYAEQLQPAKKDNVEAARKWVDTLEATGGTAIDDALKTALEMRSTDAARTFTVVFFTDGRATIGETNEDKIKQNFAKRNTANTRMFTFGVGDDVNAAMLDALADQSRAISTYVREAEDIEAKVSSLFGKISNPVLANLKLSVTNGVKLSEIYPPQLPDLFHGSQVVVLGRYDGKGHAAVKLTGTIGRETKEFVYEIDFAEKTGDDRMFVEDLWARRKVGYLLDQIRVNGENKELVNEVVTLAKRYGITTPYTSYLMVPDATTGPVASGRPGGMPAGGFGGGFGGGHGCFGGTPQALLPTAPYAGGLPPGTAPMKLEDFARRLRDGKEGKKGEKYLAEFRNKLDADRLAKAEKQAKDEGGAAGKAVTAAVKEVREQQRALDLARGYFNARQHQMVQGGKLGVDFAVQNNSLRNQSQYGRSAVRNVQTRNLLELGGVWIDEGFNAKMETVAVKAMSPAYFQMLKLHPEVRQVFQLGNYVVWVTPSGRALVIDQNAGQTELTDEAINRLFVTAKKK